MGSVTFDGDYSESEKKRIIQEARGRFIQWLFKESLKEQELQQLKRHIAACIKTYETGG